MHSTPVFSGSASPAISGLSRLPSPHGKQPATSRLRKAIQRAIAWTRAEITMDRNTARASRRPIQRRPLLATILPLSRYECLYTNARPEGQAASLIASFEERASQVRSSSCDSRSVSVRITIGANVLTISQDRADLISPDAFRAHTCSQRTQHLLVIWLHSTSCNSPSIEVPEPIDAPVSNSTRPVAASSIVPASAAHSLDDRPDNEASSRAKSREGERETSFRTPIPKANLDAILGRFADALSFVRPRPMRDIRGNRIHVLRATDASETLHTLTHG